MIGSAKIAASGINQKESTVTSNTSVHHNLYTLAGSPTVATSFRYFVPSGVFKGAPSNTEYAVDTGSGWAPGSVVIIINNGTICGSGGAGGRSGDAICPTNCTGRVLPTGGGDAIILNNNITYIDNQGVIGGGGGGGGAGQGSIDGNTGYSGGGGGAGQGYAQSTGGGVGSATCPLSASGTSGGNGIAANSGAGGNGGNGGAGGASVTGGQTGIAGTTLVWSGGGGSGGGFGSTGGAGGSATKTPFTCKSLTSSGALGGDAINNGIYSTTWINTGTRYGGF
jgi:hypothetical protein